MTPSTKLALHTLQTIPASLLNRDDSSETKTITFNGSRRVRISSQSWKRAMRMWLREQLSDTDTPFGVRTVRIPAQVIAKLVESGMDEAVAISKVAELFAGLGLKINEKTGNTSAALFVPTGAVDALAELVSDDPENIDAAKAIVTDPRALDVALFGRFLAEIREGDVEAAVSVAHSMSVEACPIIPDFFTAVDDAATSTDAASMSLGSVDLSAPTLYRHAVLDFDQLATNLGDLPVSVATRGFVSAFIESMPNAKAHSTAPNTLPGFVVAQLSKRPTSLADAFARAVDSDDVYADATKALGKHEAKASRYVGDVTTVVLAITADADELRSAFPDALVVESPDEFFAELGL